MELKVLAEALVETACTCLFWAMGILVVGGAVVGIQAALEVRK